MLTRRTERMIEALISATIGERADARSRYLFCHALHGLVRLAKAEQMMEVRRDLERAQGRISVASAREEAAELMRKIGMQLRAGARVEDGWPRG